MSEAPNDPYEQRSLSLIHGEWATLLDQSARLAEPKLHDEAMTLARAMMRRVARQIERLTGWLHAGGYEFAHRDRIWIPPQDEAIVAQQITAAAEMGVYLPISFQAWLFEVGSVNLMGTHPDWPFCGYHFDDDRLENDKPRQCTDPLVVEYDPDYPYYLKVEWDERVKKYGAIDAGPLTYDFSPDHAHKANAEGGAPYSFEIAKPSIDALVYDCRHVGSFVGHLRNAFAWGGFPGLEYIDVELDPECDPRSIVFDRF